MDGIVLRMLDFEWWLVRACDLWLFRLLDCEGRRRVGWDGKLDEMNWLEFLCALLEEVDATGLNDV